MKKAQSSDFKDLFEGDFSLGHRTRTKALREGKSQMYFT